MTKAYDEGREAYCDCKGLTDNPYDLDTKEGKDWNQGWVDAEDNDPLKDDFEDSFFDDDED